MPQAVSSSSATTSTLPTAEPSRPILPPFVGHGLVRLCQASVRRTRAGAGLPLVLHPSRRHLQQPIESPRTRAPPSLSALRLPHADHRDVRGGLRTSPP